MIFKATGGISHMLCGLAHCIEYAKKLGYFIIIDCKSATSFATEFKNLFYLENVAYSEDYTSLSTEAQNTCKVDSEPPVFIKINEIQIKKQPVQFYAGLGRSISSQFYFFYSFIKRFNFYIFVIKSYGFNAKNFSSNSEIYIVTH